MMATARAEYEARQARIQAQVLQLQASLAKHSTKAAAQSQNWGYAGDMGHVETRLQELLDFIGN